MMKFIWICATGYLYFLACLILILIAICSHLAKNKKTLILVPCLLIIASFLIICSATPRSLFFYIIWAFAYFFMLLSLYLQSIQKLKNKITAFCILISLAAFVVEVPFFIFPSLPNCKYESTFVIGDSISAGIQGLEEKTWPSILKNRHNINMENLAQSGATVESALSQAKLINETRCLVILEIGGNDLFYPTDISDYEKYLRKLLISVCQNDNCVVMLELPLLPWELKYGRAQRKLAQEFNVRLIPKRFLVKIFSTNGATVDLAHLSQHGQEVMANAMWEFFGDSINTNHNQDAN